MTSIRSEHASCKHCRKVSAHFWAVCSVTYLVVDHMCGCIMLLRPPRTLLFGSTLKIS